MRPADVAQQGMRFVTMAETCGLRPAAYRCCGLWPVASCLRALDFDLDLDLD